MPEVFVRPAEIDDGEFVWACRNDSAARAASRSSEPIPLTDHLTWFEDRLEGGATRMLIVIADGERAGYVRFDRHDDETEISIAIAATARGRGIGTAAIRAASALEASSAAHDVVAYVRDDNPASLAAFRQAGYAMESHADGMHRLVYTGSE